MQENTFNTRTNCMQAYDSYDSYFMRAEVETKLSTEYYDARKEKGNGIGTEWGFEATNFLKYNDVLVNAFNVYFNCNLDYYLINLGVSLTSVSGASNFVINGVWRIFTEDYRLLSESIIERDHQLVGRLIGMWFKESLQVQILDVDVNYP